MGFLDERVDVLCHLLPGNAMFGDVLLVVLKDTHDFLETILVLLDFLYQPGD